MIQKIPDNSVLITDGQAEDMPEFPITVTNYKNGEGISITGHDGESVYFSYRMVKELTKVLTEFSKPSKKK